MSTRRVILEHDLFFNRIYVLLACSDSLDESVVFLLQIQVLLLQLIVFKCDLDKLFSRLSLSSLALLAVRSVLLNPLFKLLCPCLEASVVLMDFIDLLDVPLALVFEFFYQLLDLIFVLLKSSLQHQLLISSFTGLTLETHHQMPLLLQLYVQRLLLALVLTLEQLLLRL